MVGPMVTNPATRDWTVTASAVRHPQRDVRQPHGVRHRPGRLRGAGHQRQADHAGHAAGGDRRHPGPRQRRGGRLQGLDAAVPVGRRAAGCEVWVAAYGPKALALAGEVGDGFILQLADPERSRSGPSARCGRPRPTPGATPTAVTICVAAPAYVTDGTAEGLAHGRDQVPLVRRDGRQPRGRHRGPLRRRPRRCRRP